MNHGVLKAKIGGVVPVMLTPFHPDGRIDWDGLAALVDWYLDHGAQALFAVCQSSEMQHLSLAERCDLARFTVKAAAGRVPVIASGHIADAIDEQTAELQAMAKTGIDCLVLVTNRLDTANAGTDAFFHGLAAATEHLPSDLPLGLYECPAPYRRLLSDDEITRIADDPRFVILKDVSCDLETVRTRLAHTRGSNLAVNNANAAIAHAALKAGADGFCGVFTNFHPDLYRWLQDEGPSHPTLADELAVFLVLAAGAEGLGYPKLAKLYHQRLGTFTASFSRAVDEDIRAKYWALDAILDKIIEGTGQWRDKIAAPGTRP
jgi:4-hydroxy-tetrahydrodipicolinate synthase